MQFPPEAERRLAGDHVAWLTTITDSGRPAPNPVWFVRDGDDLVVFSEPTARKVHNIEQRPAVALHLNSDATGGDIVVINGTATIAHGQKPSKLQPYVDKYESSIKSELSSNVDAFDATYHTEIRIREAKVRFTPAT